MVNTDTKHFEAWLSEAADTDNAADARAYSTGIELVDRAANVLKLAVAAEVCEACNDPTCEAIRKIVEMYPESEVAAAYKLLGEVAGGKISYL